MEKERRLKIFGQRFTPCGEALRRAFILPIAHDNSASTSSRGRPRKRSEGMGLPMETAMSAPVRGQKKGESRGALRVRGQALNAPAIPHGMIGAPRRLSSNWMPGLSGSISPSQVRSPSGKTSTASAGVQQFEDGLEALLGHAFLIDGHAVDAAQVGPEERILEERLAGQVVQPCADSPRRPPGGR